MGRIQYFDLSNSKFFYEKFVWNCRMKKINRTQIHDKPTFDDIIGHFFAALSSHLFQNIDLITTNQYDIYY